MEVVDLKCDELEIKPEWDIYLSKEYSLTKSYVDRWNKLCQWVRENPEPPKDWDEFKESIPGSEDKKKCDEWYSWKFELMNFERSISDERLKILRKHHAPKTEIWNFLTLSPRPMLRFEDAPIFAEWIEKIMDPKLIKNCDWVVECGKSEDAPNIHCHILFRHMNEGLSKNFKRDVSRSFKRTFKSDLNWKNSKGVGWKNVIIRNTNNPMFRQIIDDKREYLKDFQKGALHQNFMDLGLNGGF